MDSLERATAILADLVSFPTVPDASNLELIAYVADLLGGLGAAVTLSRDASGTKANLFATLGGDGDGGIVLSGHTDVVPTEGQDWTSDPFRLVARDGRLYGRGACDMKGFLACCLAAAPAFADTALKRPLHFAFTYDEEIGCFGATALVEELARTGPRPAMAIIGEPTLMGVIEGHKGCYEYAVEFTGLEGHGSQPDRGVNAVEYAVRYVARLMELAAELRDTAPAGSRFDPPWTTVQVGRISGGIARNIIPGQCVVDWEMRPVCAADADRVRRGLSTYVDTVLRPAMQAVSPAADIVTHVVGEVAGLEPVAASPALRLVSALTGDDSPRLVSFGTEAGLFQSLGVSSVVCGPGSITEAHRPDEYIALDQLAACLAMLEKLRIVMATDP